MPNHEARVNIKYNYADSKNTYLISLGWCLEVIINESSILSFEIQANLCQEIQANLCEPITSVSSLNSIKLFFLIYIGPLLKVLDGYIYMIMFLLKILFYIVSGV